MAGRAWRYTLSAANGIIIGVFLLVWWAEVAGSAMFDSELFCAAGQDDWWPCADRVPVETGELMLGGVLVVLLVAVAMHRLKVGAVIAVVSFSVIVLAILRNRAARYLGLESNESSNIREAFLVHFALGSLVIAVVTGVVMIVDAVRSRPGPSTGLGDRAW